MAESLPPCLPSPPRHAASANEPVISTAGPHELQPCSHDARGRTQTHEHSRQAWPGHRGRDLASGSQWLIQAGTCRRHSGTCIMRGQAGISQRLWTPRGHAAVEVWACTSQATPGRGPPASSPGWRTIAANVLPALFAPAGAASRAGCVSVLVDKQRRVLKLRACFTLCVKSRLVFRKTSRALHRASRLLAFHKNVPWLGPQFVGPAALLA